MSSPIPIPIPTPSRQGSHYPFQDAHAHDIPFDYPPNPPNSLVSDLVVNSNQPSQSTSPVNSPASPYTPALTHTAADDLDLEGLSLSLAAGEDEFRAWDSTGSEEYEGDARKEKKEENVQPFVVAISGASSVGKTTLAILLREIFAGNDETSIPPTIIHQDSYFLPKSQCPTIQFKSAPTATENAFMKASLAEGVVTEYTITPISSTQYLVTGPNTDTAASIDFPRLYADLLALKNAAPLRIKDEHASRIAPTLAYPNIAELKTKYAPLITEMRDKASALMKKQRGKDLNVNKYTNAKGGGKSRGSGARARFIFIEGFLLFNAPDPDSDASSSNTNPTTTATPAINSESSSPPYHPRPQNPAFNTSLNNNHTIKTITIPINPLFQISPQPDLPTHFNLTLHLKAPPSTLQTRRFARPEYTDAARGGARLPGQMWKSEGYWKDGVACTDCGCGYDARWENPDLYLGLMEQRARGKLRVRGKDRDEDEDNDEDEDGDGDGVGKTVFWAVEQILQKMVERDFYC